VLEVLPETRQETENEQSGDSRTAPAAYVATTDETREGQFTEACGQTGEPDEMTNALGVHL